MQEPTPLVRQEQKSAKKRKEVRGKRLCTEKVDPISNEWEKKRRDGSIKKSAEPESTKKMGAELALSQVLM